MVGNRSHGTQLADHASRSMPVLSTDRKPAALRGLRSDWLSTPGAVDRRAVPHHSLRPDSSAVWDSGSNVDSSGLPGAIRTRQRRSQFISPPLIFKWAAFDTCVVVQWQISTPFVCVSLVCLITSILNPQASFYDGRMFRSKIDNGMLTDAAAFGISTSPPILPSMGAAPRTVITARSTGSGTSAIDA